MTAARFIRGETAPIFPTVATATALAVGDLCANVSGNIIPAASFTWGTAVATPTAPTVANSSTAVGSELTNALTGVKISYQFYWGEGIVSAAATATPTAAAQLKVSGAPLTPAAGAMWTNIYVESSAGSGTYLKWGQSTGEAVYVNSYGAGLAPYALNAGAVVATSAATDVTQYNFALAFAGVAGQRKDATVARVHGNSTDNVVRMSVGIWEFDCASASFAVGDLVGVAKASGSTLENQKVVAVSHLALAIGRVVEVATSATRVKVEVFATLHPTSRG